MKKHFFPNTLVLICLILNSLSLNSQSVIRGTVNDKFTGKPLVVARISVVNTDITATTDSRGVFIIETDSETDIELYVVLDGYIPVFKSVNVTQQTNVQIELTPISHNLNEVEVLGYYIEDVPYAVDVIGDRQITATNNTDIGKLLTTEPNVGGIKKGVTGVDPVIRGFKYSQVAVQLNEGTRIEGGCPNRMDPTAAHVNINDLSSISIYKGPFALKYGPGFGGLVIMETFKPVFYDKFRSDVNIILGGQTNHTGYRSGIRVNGGNKYIAFVFSANRNKFGNYKSGNGDTFKATSDNYNISGGISLKIKELHSVKLHADRSWGRNVDFPTLPMDERSDNTRILNLNYTGTNISDQINFIRISAYNSNVNHVMDNKNRPFSDTVVAISEIHATNSGGRLAVGFNSLSGVAEFGTTVEYTTKDGNRFKHLIMQPNLPLLTEALWNNSKILNIGAYTEYRFTQGNFDMIGTLRFDMNNADSDPMLRVKKDGTAVYENDDTRSSYFNFSASAGVDWHFTDKNSLKLALGKGTRSPDMTERFITLLPVGYDPFDYLGNPKLKPETNHELDLGFERNCYRSGLTSINVFFSMVTDYIAAVLLPPSVLKPQTPGVLGVKQFINIEKAYLTGFEFKYLSPDRNKWQVKLNMSYTMGMNPEATKYIYENGEVIDEQIIKNDQLPEIPPFEANLFFNYKLFSAKLIPEIHYRFVARQSMVSKAYNESETPSFNILNLSFRYKYNDNLTINAGISNIFDLNYYEHLSRRIIGSKSPFYEPGRVIYTSLLIKI